MGNELDQSGSFFFSFSTLRSLPAARVLLSLVAILTAAVIYSNIIILTHPQVHCFQGGVLYYGCTRCIIFYNHFRTQNSKHRTSNLKN